jgi:hypothetical protein
MSAIRFGTAMCVVAVALATAVSARPQEPFGDAAAMIQFQRNADSYAFQHRQVQRRLGEGADQKAMAVGMRAARPTAAEGELFTPTIAAAFLNRIAFALREPGCRIGASETPSSEVPRVGVLALRSQALPSCLTGVLPHLPEELEYRAVGVVLILIDTHANTVVDVLHGAFPMRP